MFAVKLLANQRLLAIVALFRTCPAFSHFTFHILLEVLYYNWSWLNAVNNVLTSYIKFCYVYVNFKQSNKSSSPTKISQSINGEWRTCDRNGLVITILLVKARKVVWWSEERSNWKKRKRNKVMGCEKRISTRFRYISKLFKGAKDQESW